MTRKTETVAHLDASIKRWKTRLKRAVTMIDKLEKKRKRLMIKDVVAKQLAKQQEKVVVFEPDPQPVPSPAPRHVDDPGLAHPDNSDSPAWATPDTDIPEFLRRGAAAQAAVNDVIAAEEIKAEAAATKKAKAAGRIAKMKAKKAGDLKKMPLSGKAARDLINNG